MVRFIRSAFIVAFAIGAATPAFAQPAKKAPAAATDDLSLLPVDSEMVAGLDFQSLQTSQLWKQFVEPMLGKGDVKKQMDEFKTNCGVDPMKVVTKISIGIKGIGQTNPDGVIVAHGVPKAKLVACYDKMTKMKKTDADITRDGDVLIVKQKSGGQTVAFSFLDDTTAVMVVGTQATAAGVKGVVKGTSALKTSTAFVDFYKKTNTNDTLWLIMNGNSKAFDQLGAMGIKPKAVYGSLNVTKDLTLDLKVRFNTADEAKNLSTMVNGQLKAAASMFDKITVTADGSDMKVAVLLTDAKLKALMKQFAPMMNKQP
ncbi:MAG: hypothetical protein ABI867_06735 [Kofleriaceae bacterium]